MEAKLETVVAALQKRFNENGACSHPLYAYNIAWELTNALTLNERQCQLLRLLAVFEGDQNDCTVAHVVVAGSLMSAGVFVSDLEVKRWETAMTTMLMAHPPFSKDVILAVCFCIAQVALSGCSVALIEASGASLCGVVTTTHLSEDVAMEILAECADALVKTQQEEEKDVVKEKYQLRCNLLKDMLIGYALDALFCPQSVPVPSSLLSCRVLIPLLLSGGHEALRSHHSRIESLLQSLSKDTTRQGEVVVLIASIFDYLFSPTVGDGLLDYRCSTHLWKVLYGAFWDALTSDADAGRRANMQLRAEYLLKRIVDFTYEQELREKWTSNTSFHQYFVWVPAVSYTQWTLFFLVLEATNEFGVHIIQPALRKLDVLAESLVRDAAAWNCNNSGSNAEVSIEHFSGGLHPAWVELLFLKLLSHPNTAIRKAGLQRLWSLDTSVLRFFSSAFMFTNAVEASLDSQLSAEVDRTPRVALFTRTKGFEGGEVRSLVGMAGPLADQLERFYARVFRDVLRTADARKEAMYRMLHSVVLQPSVYCVTMLLCILHGVAEALALDREEVSRRATLEMITDTRVLQELLLVLRDAAHEKAPYWLDVRLSAVAFSALLHFARIDAAAVRHCDEFWRLLCICGPLGNSGGGSATAVDLVEHIGAVGTCIHPCFMNDQLLRMSRAFQVNQSDFAFMRTLLQTSSLLEGVRQFLRAGFFDEARGKQLLFLSGALDMAGPEDKQLLAEVAHEIATALLSFARRSYSLVGSLLAGLLAFVEFCHSVGPEACTRYFSKATVIDLSDTLHTFALSALRRATLSITTLNTSDDFIGEVWALQHTTEWDAVVAAALCVGQVAHFHDPTGATMWPQTRQRVNDLVQMLVLNVDEPQKDDLLNVTSKVTRHFAKMVVSRNTSRLLQAILCGLISSGTPMSDQQDVDNTEIFCRSQIDSTDPSRWIRSLVQCPLLRLATCDIPCSLTGLSWATVLAQYYGAIYNAVFVLCNFVNPNEFPELVVELQEYGLDHMERCWGTNLTSVYDILAWVAATVTNTDGAANIKGVDHRAIISAMFGHLKDVGAREYGRVSLLAFNVLRCGLVEHVELVKSHISRALLDKTDSERSVYVAAVTIATEVLRDPEVNWPHLKDFLLHVAVLYNSGRDEEASESMVAATEPLLLSWSERLRVQYPPTVRLSSVGRALAITTILWCCHLRPDWATEVSLELLDWNINHAAVKLEPCMPNSKPHRCRIRLWQLLCSLLPMIDNAVAERDILKTVVQKCLSLTNMGSVRRLMELYALKLLERQPSMYGIVDAAMANYKMRPQACGSFLLIMAHMVLQQIRGEVERVDGLFETLLHRLFQQSTSHQHLLRIICHIGLYHIYENCLKRGVTFSPSEEMIFNYIAHAPEHVKFREKHTENLFFDLNKACTPRELFCIQRKEGNNLLMESIPAAAFERMRYLNYELRSLIGALSPVEMLRVRNILDRIESRRTLEPLKSFPFIPHTESHTTYCVDYTAEAIALLTADSGNSDVLAGGDENIQRKVTPWKNNLVYNELHPRALKKKRQSVIVISSLLQNPVNVAGLFRCGEIFTVEKIVVSDPSVFEHPHFVAAARSAELWLPWDSVQAKDLAPYLGTLRQGGYTLIGIEQTASSVSMASYNFPERVAILLGAEGHGVPAELLPLLDVCVEIPQFGLIRSLNVHVTGAIVMYEYTRQHLMK